MTSALLLTVAEARERILASIHSVPEERVAIDDALDRVLARDLRAVGNVPPFGCSAMDGYAVIGGRAGRTLRVIGESRAGVPSELAIGAHEAIRTSTGAALPAGADAVIRQECVEADRDRIILRADVAVGADIRHAGDDFAAGATLLRAGTTLGAPELAAVVAAGASDLWCACRPRVAILCTGTELRSPGEPLGPGEIHNANAVTLWALATRCGALAAPAERLAVDRAAIESAIAAALRRADVVVVSGGVSAGPHDHVKPALDSLGVSQSFWGVAIRPGKPTWFGSRGGCLVFGLPGNPVAAYVTFALFTRPALLALQGSSPDRAAQEVAELGVPVQQDPSREQAIRVRLERTDAHTIAIPTGPQGSNLISSLLRADALVMIPAGTGELEVGSRVRLIALPR